MLTTAAEIGTRESRNSCTVSKRRKRGNRRRQQGDITVDIDVRVWADICKFFPVDGEHHRTKKFHTACRMIIVTFIYKALKHKKCQFTFNTEVMDRMTGDYGIGSKKRKALVNYFDQSRFFKVVVAHSKGHHATIRGLKGARVRRVLGYQHNMVPPAAGLAPASVPVPVDMATALAVTSADALVGKPERTIGQKGSSEDGGTVVGWCRKSHQMPRWRFTGKTCSVTVPRAWYLAHGASFRTAATALHSDSWKWLPCVTESMKQCVFRQPTLETCLKHALLKEDSSDCDDESLPPEERAQLCFDNWSEFRAKPLAYLFRKNGGRLYHPLESQSKFLRREYMFFNHNGVLEPTAEVDLHASYWVLLSTMLDDSPTKSRLQADLAIEMFYKLLNEDVGGVYETKSELKVAVQTHCLFGKRDFGKHPLFLAMKRRYSDLARLILHKRRNHNVTWMSHLLSKAEGEFFIEELLPFVFNAGIPCLPIHDCLLVPASEAERVRGMAIEMAKRCLGFEPFFSVKYGGAKVEYVSEGNRMAEPNYEPTPKQIAAECLAIQATWTPEQRLGRMRADWRPSFVRADSVPVEMSVDSYDDHHAQHESFAVSP